MNEFAAGRFSLFVSNVTRTARPMAMMKVAALAVAVFRLALGRQEPYKGQDKAPFMESASFRS
jgi:hypothetical protein